MACSNFLNLFALWFGKFRKVHSNLWSLHLESWVINVILTSRLFSPQEAQRTPNQKTNGKSCKIFEVTLPPGQRQKSHFHFWNGTLVSEPRATPHMVLHGAQTRGNWDMILPTVADNLGYTFLKMNSHWAMFWFRVSCFDLGSVVLLRPLLLIDLPTSG